MADQTSDRPEPGRAETQSTPSETDRDKDRRLQYLHFAGPPMPEGWKLPSLINPPTVSDPDSLRRADREIGSLKVARFESWRPVPFDAGMAIEPAKKGHWNEMTEFAKLDVMQHWINWEGVSNSDRVGMMAGQLDLEKLPPDVRDQIRKDAGLAHRVEDHGFEATAASQRPRSPSDLASEARTEGRERAGPETRRPSDIAKERGTGEPAPEKALKNDNDNGR